MIDSSLLHDLLVPSARNARIWGVAVGIVTNNQDPAGLGRVRVRLPWLTDDDETHWARVVTLMAGKDRGVFFLPEVDDEVLVAFEHGDMRFPYVLGALWNGQDVPPASNEDGQNNLRLIKSRSGHCIQLDDTQGEEQIVIIDRSGKNRIVINTKDNAIIVEADAAITICAKRGKLKLSGNGVEINSQGAVTITAGQAMDLKANTQLNIRGQMVNIN